MGSGFCYCLLGFFGGGGEFLVHPSSNRAVLKRGNVVVREVGGSMAVVVSVPQLKRCFG